MNKKSVLPLAAVLAIGAAWTMLSESGKKPLIVNMNPLGKSTTRTTVRVEAESPRDQIAALFSSRTQGIQVQDISCQDASCVVELSGEPDALRAHIENLVRENPWLGPWNLQEKAGSEGVFQAVFQPRPRS
ncbi:MAG TPA: hypothetical protein VFO10_05600 [Oligoflexus sp.]|uniref:hypothetical protein n=1 Tax=Oligoflexus sp. TaxID=1971216 RepID=UPI002D80EF43|nr:hypothetical protein [Oligoflexus sp.]HET9236701.1 hypothetical protein [Oligoflexus sp.]